MLYEHSVATTGAMHLSLLSSLHLAFPCVASPPSPAMDYKTVELRGHDGGIEQEGEVTKQGEGGDRLQAGR